MFLVYGLVLCCNGFIRIRCWGPMLGDNRICFGVGGWPWENPEKLLGCPKLEGLNVSFKKAYWYEITMLLVCWGRLRVRARGGLLFRSVLLGFMELGGVGGKPRWRKGGFGFGCALIGVFGDGVERVGRH